jgi:predicted RND superfamily exporter protein
VLGFASLAISSVLAIRGFGIWSVVGVSATTIVALTFLPAALVALGPARRTPLAPQGGRIDAFAERLAHFDVRHKRWIFGVAIAVLVIAVAGALRIRVDNLYIKDFAADAPVRTDYEAINERLGGANALMIIVEADEDFAFTRPENLAALRDLQSWLEAQPEISVTTSIADVVMLLNRAFHDDDPAAFAIPDEARATRQLLFFGGDEVTRGFADKKLRTVHVAARSRVADSEPASALQRRITQRLQQLPAGLHGRVTGDAVLLARTVDEIARGQLESIATALLTIYLTLSALLMSFRVGLIALLPNLLPIAVYYGVLGLFDIPLGLATSLIGSIALGIAVDDTVHYFTRFNLDARRLGSEHDATVATLRSLIRPVTFTTAGLCLGFLMLTFSEMRSQVQFGLLAAFTLAVAWMLELTLSPALCSSVRLVTLWDLLGLDLGDKPEREVPLFEGLSGRQARIFALMSALETKPAGTRLCSEGEPGNDMFVVIDGELSASLPRDGGRVEFARMRRGETVGEIAIFSGLRSADVDVVADARVLRFDDAALGRLRRRYPRIAAVVNHNLARLLAERVMNTTRTLR